jgi:hypothetical protein
MTTHSPLLFLFKSRNDKNYNRIVKISTFNLHELGIFVSKLFASLNIEFR